MEYLTEWITLVVVFGLAAISPGPDFVMAVRNSVIYSRRAGLFTAMGFAFAVCVHAFYSIIGVGALIAQSVLLFSMIKYIGAGYLLYIGFKALRSKGYNMPSAQNDKTIGHLRKEMGAVQALRSGFITNLFNPKATLFFLALFTQILSPETPYSVQAFFGLTCAVMVWAWFTLVALFLTHRRIQAVFLGFSKWIDRVCGGLMVALGIKLALTK
jgi:RhtB (resistance to homoserine/threonine) family protein